MRNIVKYVGIVLVIAGILLVTKNLFTQDEEWTKNDTKKDGVTEVITYSAKIKLLDKKSNSHLKGGVLVLKNEDGEVVEKWTTNGEVHVVDKLLKGKYTIEQETVPSDYKVDEKVVSFKITNKDTNIIVYNTKMTKQEKEEEEQKNTTSNEVKVDNTLSEKSILSIFGGIVSIALGVGLILIQKRSSNNDV